MGARQWIPPSITDLVKSLTAEAAAGSGLPRPGAGHRLAYPRRSPGGAAFDAFTRSPQHGLPRTCVMVSGLIIGLPQQAQVADKAFGGGQGVGVILAQDTAAPLQGVLVQGPGSRHLPQLAQ